MATGTDRRRGRGLHRTRARRPRRSTSRIRSPAPRSSSPASPVPRRSPSRCSFRFATSARDGVDDLLLAVTFGISGILEGVLPLVATLRPSLSTITLWSLFGSRGVTAIVVCLAAWLPRRRLASRVPDYVVALSATLGAGVIVAFTILRTSGVAARRLRARRPWPGPRRRADRPRVPPGLLHPPASRGLRFPPTARARARRRAALAVDRRGVAGDRAVPRLHVPVAAQRLADDGRHDARRGPDRPAPRCPPRRRPLVAAPRRRSRRRGAAPDRGRSARRPGAGARVPQLGIAARGASIAERGSG